MKATTLFCCYRRTKQGSNWHHRAKYKQHKISVEEAIRKISWKDNKGDQYCFKTKRALTLLKEQAVFVLHKNKYGKWYQERR